VGLNQRFLNHGGVVNHVLGGWQVNEITTLSDGVPFDIGCGCGDEQQTGNTYNVQKPNLVGNPLAGITRSDYQWFNPAAFAVPTLGTAGNLGRNILRTTHQTAVDFSAMKTNRITERVNLQFRAEFFNFFSSETYFPLYPSGTMTAANFGMIIDKALNQSHANLFNPRIIQLALKMNF
jgi:hypothetical protein